MIEMMLALGFAIIGALMIGIFIYAYCSIKHLLPPSEKYIDT